MNIVGHFQGIWPEICLDGVGPTVASMYHHRARQVLHVSDPFLQDSVLKVGVYSAVRDRLPAGLDVIYEHVFCKAAIIRVVMPDPYAMGCAVGLELSLALQSLFRPRTFLNVYIGQPTEVVNKHGGAAIALDG